MQNQNPPPDPSVVETMQRIHNKSAIIARQQARADAGKFTSYGAALGLQKQREDRRELQASLPPLRIVESA